MSKPASITATAPSTPGTISRTEQKTISAVPGLAYHLSAILVIVALIASSAGFFITDLFQRDHPALAGCARGTALVILTVALPVMVIAMILSRRGSVKARLVWLGMVTYILYNAGYFTFSASFNHFFLAFLAMLSLAFWTLLVLLVRWPVQEVKEMFGPRTPVRFTAIAMLFPVLIFLITDLREVVSSSLNNNIPASIVGTQLPTNHFHIMDLAFLVPLFILGAAWLWRRQAWGYTITGMLMSYYTIELLGIGVDQWFGGKADPGSTLANAAFLPAFVLLSILSLAVLTRFLRHLGK